MSIEQENTLDNILKFMEDWPEADSEGVRDGLTLLRLHREIEMLSELYAARLGLSARQMETLEVLFHHPDRSLTPAQLADEIHLTRSAMTSNLDSLQRKGFINRTMHPDDRRMISITLTQKGTEFSKENMPKRYRDIIRIMGILSPDERRQLHDFYRRLVQFLKQISEEEGN